MDNTMLTKVIEHARNRDYMSGIERERSRVKSTGEVFTPTKLVQEMLDQLPPALFTDPKKTFLDPTCGDGQFLSEVLIRKMENGISYEQALSTIYGVDLMEDNCIETIKRLYMVEESDIIVVKKSPNKLLDVRELSRAHRSKPGLIAMYQLKSKPGKFLNIVCANGLEYDYSFSEPQPMKERPQKTTFDELFAFE